MPKIKNRKKKTKESFIKKLGKSRELLRSILEVAPFGVYIVNKKGAIEYVNSVMTAISGDTYEQFKSLNVFKLPSYKKLSLDDKIRSVFEGHSFSMESVEYTSYYSKKTTIRNFMGIPFKENVEKKALIFVEDITKIKKAEEEMKRAMAIRSQFISMVSHELRTPLAAIKGGVDLILSEKKGPLNKEQKEFLDISKRNVDRLARLINSVLDYQKLDAGRMEFNMEKDDINELISDVSKQMEPLIKEKGLVLRISLGTDTPRINFDKDKIEQVLMNLINNALKFTEKGSITISSSKLNNAVCVSVADTGIGIRKEDMDKLFLSFSQIATGKERKTGGTGLGLAISKKILREHHGKIRAQSESGAGSKFSFFLPIRERRG